MGYSHNWTIVMPQGDDARFLFKLESICLVHLLPHFELDIGDDGTTILHHKSGQAEGFALGRCGYDFGESCKTDKGMAEIHIVEMLWRTAFAINDAGGTMRIHSDCTWVPLRDKQLDPTAATFLAVLMHRCADLLKGRTIKVEAVPRAWPQIGSYSHVLIAQNQMLTRTADGTRFDQVLFAVDDRNEADYGTILQPGTPSFSSAVFRHTQAVRFNQPNCLRGLYSHTLRVRVDGKLFAGTPDEHDQHAEVVKRTLDIKGLIPDAEWLQAEIADRQAEEEGVV